MNNLNPVLLFLQKSTILLSLLISVNFSCTNRTDEVKQTYIELKTGDLTAVIADNEAYGETHKGGYNGISELYHTRQDSNIFVPLFSGFNLEHIFGGDSLVSLFEPRREPMSVKKISDTEVLLHQPETSISNVESWTTYKLVAPHYIDVDFKFKVHKKAIFNHGYAGLFWASYINAPEDKSIYFRGTSEGAWEQTFSPKHGLNSTILSENDPGGIYIAPNFNIDLAKTFSDKVFSQPFYYGRYKNMVFAYLFSHPEEGIIRFSQSPNGAGPTNPAWDFQYIVPDFEVNREYSFKTRLVYKEWVDNADIASEYESWVGSLID